MFHVLIFLLFSQIRPSFMGGLAEREVDMEDILEWKFGKPFTVNILNSNKVKQKLSDRHLPVHDQADFTPIQVGLEEADKIEKCVRDGMAPKEVYYPEKIYDNLINLPIVCMIAIKYSKMVYLTSTEGYDEHFLTLGKYRPYKVKSKAGTEISDTIAKVRDMQGDSVMKVTIQNDLSTSFDISASYKQEEKHKVKETVSKSYSTSLSASLGVVFYSFEMSKTDEKTESNSKEDTSSKSTTIKKTVTVNSTSLQMMTIKMSSTTTTEMVYQQAFLSGYVAFRVFEGLDDGTEIWFLPISEYAKLLPTEFKVDKDDPNRTILYLTGMRENVIVTSQAYFTPYFDKTEITNVFDKADK